MKLLLDENLSRRLVPFLQQDYPGSSQVLLLGLALALLGWRAERDLAAMCTDAWRWQSSNLNGYASGAVNQIIGFNS